jgi:hypothetical protein
MMEYRLVSTSPEFKPKYFQKRKKKEKKGRKKPEKGLTICP